jgi:hypothetical protein
MACILTQDFGHCIVLRYAPSDVGVSPGGAEACSQACKRLETVPAAEPQSPSGATAACSISRLRLDPDPQTSVPPDLLPFFAFSPFRVFAILFFHLRSTGRTGERSRVRLERPTYKWQAGMPAPRTCNSLCSIHVYIIFCQVHSRSSRRWPGGIELLRIFLKFQWLRREWGAS